MKEKFEKSLELLKNTKLVTAIVLLVNAVSSLVMFFILLSKKKSIAGAFLALAALSGASGAYLFIESKDDIIEKAETDLEEDAEESDEDDLDLEEGNLFSREED